MKEITKQQKLLMDKCPICKKEITGYSEAQVNSRMNMHMRSHKGSVSMRKAEGKNE